MAVRTTPPVQEMVKDRSKAFIVSLVFRPGVRLFSAMLEYGRSPPTTPAHDDFNTVVVPWKGMNYYLLIIPRKALPLARKVAQSIGMDVRAKTPAVPRFVGSDLQFEKFPLTGANVYSLVGAYEGDDEEQAAHAIINASALGKKW